VRERAKHVSTPTRTDERPVGEYREYLLLLARIQLGTRFRGKLDASDVVQLTILHSHAHREQFRGTTEAEWLAWLRAILANTIAGTVREFATAGRDLGRERSLETELERSAARLESLLVADQTSASAGAVRAEELLSLARALCRLPGDQRLSIELHHLNGLPIAEVAARLGRTRPAVVGLLFRGLKKLRELLRDEPEGEA
jgi:RNA polymerase sigma-70 factor (ECF subfamily)